MPSGPAPPPLPDPPRERQETLPVYAAYAGNLDPARMASRAPHSPQRGTGWLVGWRLTFGGADLGWDGALATVVEDPDEQVFVALYDVSAQDEAALDQWEGIDVGIYRKIRVRVETLDGDVLAWVYVLDAYEGGLPSAARLALIADAAEKAGAPHDYVLAIQNRECLPSDPLPPG